MVQEYREAIQDRKTKDKLQKLGKKAVKEMEKQAEIDEAKEKDAHNPRAHSIDEIKKRSRMGTVQNVETAQSWTRCKNRSQFDVFFPHCMFFC